MKESASFEELVLSAKKDTQCRKQESEAIMARKPQPPPSRTNKTSAIVGGVLLAIGILWLAWILIAPHLGSVANNSTLPIPFNGAITPFPVVQVTELQAVGVTLSQAGQKPNVNQNQALLLASQLEPDAAARAKSTIAQYVLLNYTSVGPGAHTSLNNVPAWMVSYQKIPLDTSSYTSVDPTPFPRTSRNLYVFLDANNGKQLLVVSV